jgi:hypothetical protein
MLLICQSAHIAPQDILTSEAGAGPPAAADSGDEEEDDKYAAVRTVV